MAACLGLDRRVTSVIPIPSLALKHTLDAWVPIHRFQSSGFCDTPTDSLDFMALSPSRAASRHWEARNGRHLFQQTPSLRTVSATRNNNNQTSNLVLELSSF